ncbi:hypothetical protein Pfo_014854 [Paulownia fortunei]|nr:hypothetical protein Pfo_014854 [Paulownia fortunei]
MHILLGHTARLEFHSSLSIAKIRQLSSYIIIINYKYINTLKNSYIYIYILNCFLLLCYCLLALFSRLLIVVSKTTVVGIWFSIQLFPPLCKRFS